MDKADSIWLDGSLVPWEQAQVHVLTHTLHYGLGVFEGIRAYKQPDGSGAVFRLDEHVDRLLASAKIATLESPWSRVEIANAVVDTLAANKLAAAYIRPLMFLGDGAMGLGAMANPTRLCIATWPWGAYLGDDGLRNGIRVRVSSYQRPSVNALMARGKICGHYVNSMLAKREALRDGYDEAILLDAQGYVCEATGENVFAVSADKLLTPPAGSSLLPGITRNTVFELANREGLPVEERALSRDELYLADELFLCGTAAEVTPVRELDGRPIGGGERGPVTSALQRRYFGAVQGTEADTSHWRRPIRFES